MLSASDNSLITVPTEVTPVLCNIFHSTVHWAVILQFALPNVKGGVHKCYMSHYRPPFVEEKVCGRLIGTIRFALSVEKCPIFIEQYHFQSPCFQGRGLTMVPKIATIGSRLLSHLFQRHYFITVMYSFSW